MRWEIGIVLFLSLGRSAVYAIVDLAEKLTRAPLSEQTTTLNPALASRELFDFIYQVLGIAFSLVPVLLVFHLVWLRGRNPFRVFGLDGRRPGRDLLWGVGLFLAMGLGTLAVYAAGRAAGITTALVGSAMGEYWWSAPVLVLSAVRHALLEEVIIIAWLFDRLGYLQQLRRGRGVHADAVPVQATTTGQTPSGQPWRRSATGAFLPVRPAVVILACALLRASYHLYQGFGPGIGNLVMGIVFGLVYLRCRRVMPLVICHLLLDATGFVAYPLLAQLGWFGT